MRVDNICRRVERNSREPMGAGKGMEATGRLHSDRHMATLNTCFLSTSSQGQLSATMIDAENHRHVTALSFMTTKTGCFKVSFN